MLNSQSCLGKLLCGVEIAEKPTSSSSTLNDYAFAVKNFFDSFSYVKIKYFRIITIFWGTLN